MNEIQSPVYLNRRSWLKTSGLAVGSFLMPGSSVAATAMGSENSSSSANNGKSFQHRGYLGWITDLASTPDANAAWPSMRLDERLLDDYRESYAILRRLGFNEIVIWGLYVSRAWPVDIASAVTPSRGALVEKLIHEAHNYGLRVLSGLGVYSWGFEEIIRANPELNRGNPQVLCASDPESWKWMQRVIDFVFNRFAIDGVSMQSADQGRCRCSQCQKYSDIEYHALLNVHAAEYIRQRWPSKIIGVCSWGMRFDDPANLPSLVKISQSIDYLIDSHDSSRSRDSLYRRQLIQSLQCGFGTLGGPQVEPPQHWRRDRWFLPILKRTAEHIRQLADDGGRACEYFFHIQANPGDELTLYLAGQMLSNPRTSWEKHLQSAVDELYQPSSAALRDDLIQVFLRAEEAYMQYLPDVRCGTISMEPLVSDRPGPPIYLQQRLNPQQREEYEKTMKAILIQLERIQSDILRKEKTQKIIQCVNSVLSDLAQLKQE